MGLSNALCSLLGTFSDRPHYLKAKQAHVKQTPKRLEGFCCSVRRFHHNLMPVTAGLPIFCQTEDPNRGKDQCEKCVTGPIHEWNFNKRVVRCEQTDGYSIALADAVYTPIGFVAKSLYLTRSSLFVSQQNHFFMVHSSLLSSPTKGETYICKEPLRKHPSVLW